MNWIILSIIIVLTSVTNCLVIRKLIQEKVPLEIQRLVNFILPTLLLLLYIIIFKLDWQINLLQLSIIIISSILFSWLGGIFSMKALEKAPNPGYSLIISKSYIILTSILSVFFFNISFKPRGIFAIFLVLIFSSLIVIKGKTKAKNSNTWIVYSFGAFIAWGLLSIVWIYLNNSGIEPIVSLFYVMLIVSFLIFSEIKFKKIPITIFKKNYFTIGIVGISSLVNNWSIVEGYKVAPNPNFINGINVGSIAIITIFSYIFFKDELSLKKIIGIFGVICGLILFFW